MRAKVFARLGKFVFTSWTALRKNSWMDGLTLFGLVAVTAMLVCYALEKRSHWFVLAFAGSCVLASAYGFLQGAWPFGMVEGVWSIVALRRWWLESRGGTPA
jgi:hypothetical protein